MGDDFYSAENNFGYTYTPDYQAMYGGKSPDPKVTYYSGEMPAEQRIPAYTSSDAHWDQADIDAIHTAIFTLHDGHLKGAATGWEKIVQLLNHVKQSMSDAAKGLAPGWDPAKSSAATNFFHHIGASMWSIDDWITFANQNKHALESVATAVNKARTDMEAIYKNYLSEWNTNIDKANYIASPAYQQELDQTPDYNVGLATSPTKTTAELQQPFIDAAKAAREKYTKQARDVIKKLTGEYASNWGAINEGRKFQGPTNAESPLAALTDKLKQIMANSGGGGNFGNPTNFTTQNNALQQQLKQQQEEAAKKAAEAEAAAKKAQEKALAEQKAAADLAKQQALQAQQEALKQQQLAQQQLDQLQAQQQNVDLGDPVAFPVTGPGATGLQNAGGRRRGATGWPGPLRRARQGRRPGRGRRHPAGERGIPRRPARRIRPDVGPAGRPVVQRPDERTAPTLDRPARPGQPARPARRPSRTAGTGRAARPHPPRRGADRAPPAHRRRRDRRRAARAADAEPAQPHRAQRPAGRRAHRRARHGCRVVHARRAGQEGRARHDGAAGSPPHGQGAGDPAAGRGRCGRGRDARDRAVGRRRAGDDRHAGRAQARRAAWRGARAGRLTRATEEIHSGQTGFRLRRCSPSGRRGE